MKVKLWYQISLLFLFQDLWTTSLSLTWHGKESAEIWKYLPPRNLKTRGKNMEIFPCSWLWWLLHYNYSWKYLTPRLPRFWQIKSTCKKFYKTSGKRNMYMLNDNARNATMCVSWKHHSLFLCEAYERVIWWFDVQISFGVSSALRVWGEHTSYQTWRNDC